jgi:Rab3 GTPase-activating protein catalytic subunit
MVCTAFRASADTLHQPNFGGLKLMTTKMEQLYHTIASTLKPLQSISYLPFSCSSCLFLDHLRMWVLRSLRILSLWQQIIYMATARPLKTLDACVLSLNVLKSCLLLQFLFIGSSCRLHACLSEAIFTDYHNFYLPRMGTGSTGLLDVDEKVKLSSCHSNLFPINASIWFGRVGFKLWNELKLKW